MHDALWLELLKIIGALVGLASGAFFTYWRVKQKRLSSEMGLADNPERCGRHEEAIKQLRSDMDDMCDENRDDHREMLKQIAGLSVEIAKLSRNGSEAR